MEILKSIWKSTRWYLLTVIVCIIVMRNCNCIGLDSNKTNVFPNEVKTIVDTIKVLQTKIVTLDSIRTKFVYKWRTVKDTVNLTDTVEVLKLLNICDTIILTDSIEIHTLKNINFQYIKILKIDSLKIDSLTKSNKKFWKGFKKGFAAGSVLTGCLILTTQIIK